MTPTKPPRERLEPFADALDAWVHTQMRNNTVPEITDSLVNPGILEIRQPGSARVLCIHEEWAQIQPKEAAEWIYKTLYSPGADFIWRCYFRDEKPAT